jgi:hypothetical protein
MAWLTSDTTETVVVDKPAKQASTPVTITATLNRSPRETPPAFRWGGFCFVDR